MKSQVLIKFVILPSVLLLRTRNTSCYTYIYVHGPTTHMLWWNSWRI